MSSDLINRQDLIDSFKYDDDGTAWSMDDIIYRIEQFPSAQETQGIEDKADPEDNGRWR